VNCLLVPRPHIDAFSGGDFGVPQLSQISFALLGSFRPVQLHWPLPCPPCPVASGLCGPASLASPACPASSFSPSWLHPGSQTVLVLYPQASVFTVRGSLPWFLSPTPTAFSSAGQAPGCSTWSFLVSPLRHCPTMTRLLIR
jgi:hypothetical protein